MEIEFNPSQLPPSGPSGTVARAETAPVAADAVSLQSVTDLRSKLESIPLTRAERVAEMKPLASNVQYPPDEILNSIADLLAIHLRN